MASSVGQISAGRCDVQNVKKRFNMLFRILQKEKQEIERAQSICEKTKSLPIKRIIELFGYSNSLREITPFKGYDSLNNILPTSMGCCE